MFDAMDLARKASRFLAAMWLQDVFNFGKRTRRVPMFSHGGQNIRIACCSRQFEDVQLPAAMLGIVVQVVARLDQDSWLLGVSIVEKVRP